MQRVLRLFLLMASLNAAVAHAAVVELTLPKVSGQRHLYFARILEESLRMAGHTPRFRYTQVLPQPRVWAELESGEIDVFWALQTSDRDAKFLAAGSNITGGMYGQRVLVVRKSDLPLYAQTKSLDEFRTLGKIGAFGNGWFDVDVWKSNNLPYVEWSGDWNSAFYGLRRENSGVDYLARSVLEVQEELRERADDNLAIEPSLLFIYGRDGQFYLAQGRQAQQKLIDDALKKAQKSGLLQRITNEYFKKVSSELKLNSRKRLMLSTPAQ